MRSTPGDSVRPSGNVLGIEFSCRHGGKDTGTMHGGSSQVPGTGRKQLKECAPCKVCFCFLTEPGILTAAVAVAAVAPALCPCPLRLPSALALCACPLLLPSSPALCACGCGCSCPLRLHPLKLLAAAPAGSRRAPKRLGCSRAAGAWRCCGGCTSAEVGKRQGGCGHGPHCVEGHPNIDAAIKVAAASGGCAGPVLSLPVVWGLDGRASSTHASCTSVICPDPGLLLLPMLPSPYRKVGCRKGMTTYKQAAHGCGQHTGCAPGPMLCTCMHACVAPGPGGSASTYACGTRHSVGSMTALTEQCPLLTTPMNSRPPMTISCVLCDSLSNQPSPGMPPAGCCCCWLLPSLLLLLPLAACTGGRWPHRRCCCC